MSIVRRMSEPVRAPLRDRALQYSSFFEHLIHAVKNEMVSRVERIEGRLGDLDEKAQYAHGATTDQLAIHAAALRQLEVRMEQLQSLAESTLGDVSEVRDEIRATRKEVVEKVYAVAPSVRLGELSEARLDDIDLPASHFLNHVQSWNGPLADAGLFINHPYLVEWSEGSAQVRLVNERIIEQPFVYAALADVPLGSRVLDIGGGESIVALALASLGHKVTVVEPRGYPFRHHNLEVFECPIEQFDSDQSFDAVVLLSTIEHLGIGHYADGTSINGQADLEAMAIVRGLTRPGGRLVLTTPYGESRVTELERIYDRDGLLQLLEGWHIRSVALGRRINEVGWEVDSTELVEPAEIDRVAMVVASLSPTS
jgi:SAM-dependent methyltransferase